MSADRYPFGPVPDEPRKVMPWTGGSGGGDPRDPRFPGEPRKTPPIGPPPRGRGPIQPRPGDPPKVPGLPGPQPPAPETGMAPTPMAPTGVGMQASVATDPVRQEALDRLLGRAALYGDRGDSTKTITDLLMGVDMGRAGRASGMWDARNAGLASAGEQYLTGTTAALKALRAKRGSGGGRSGGGGGSTAMAQMGLTPADYAWLDQYMQSLQAPGSAPAYTAPRSATPGAGYGASQHPVAPRRRVTPRYGLRQT